MKKKCEKCNTICDITSYTNCPTCQSTKGFLQIPKNIKTDIGNIHLEDLITHINTKNAYKIKEIQQNGFIAVLHKNPLDTKLNGLKAYITKNELTQYKLGE